MTGANEHEAAALDAVLDEIGAVAVAVSGGVDSMTLAVVAGRRLGTSATMIHATSPAVSLGLHFRFQSSVPHGVVERHTDGSGHPIDVRSRELRRGA